MYCRSSAQRLGWQGPTMCNRYPLEIKHGNRESPAFYVGFIWFYMVLYGFIWFYIIWFYMVLYYMVLYGFIWFSMVLYGFIWFYMVLYGFMWFYHSKFNTDRENKPLFNGNSSSNPYLPVSMLIYWRVYHSKNIYKWVIFHCHVWLPEG